MKILLVLSCILSVCLAEISLRLDTFADIGNRTPKNVFDAYDNVYFRTYADVTNETIINIKINNDNFLLMK